MQHLISSIRESNARCGPACDALWKVGGGKQHVKYIQERHEWNWCDSIIQMYQSWLIRELTTWPCKLAIVGSVY